MQWVARGLKRLQGLTGDYKGLKKGVQVETGGEKGLQGVTGVYKGSQGATRGSKG